MLNAVLTFVAMVMLDFVWAYYTMYTSSRNALGASFSATGIMIITSVVTILYVNNHYLIPIVGIGAFIGTYTAIWLEVRRKK